MFNNGQDLQFNFTKFFVPLTTRKAICIITVLGFFVYGNSLVNGFVWDDLGYIVYNSDVHSINLIKIFSANLFNSSGYYRPISALYFSLLYALFGLNTFFYHFFQISLHITNACLIFILFRKFIKNTYALFLSILFIVHPINVESVVYIGASQSEIFFLFGMFALLITMRNEVGWRQLLISFGFLLLAALTKETGILFVFLVLDYRVIFKKQNTQFFVLGAFTISTYILIRLGIGHNIPTIQNFIPIARLSLTDRLLNIPGIAFYYLKTLIFPSRLAINQLWIIREINLQNFYIPLLADSLFIIGILVNGLYIWTYKKNIFKPYLFFLIWFVFSFLILLQFFPLDMTVADRWFYLPFAGLLGALGIICTEINLRRNLVSKILVCCLISVIITLACRTIIRNSNWNNNLTIYSHDIPLEDNFDNESNYASFLGIAGEYQLELEHIKKSVALYPYEFNMKNLGSAYLDLGQKQIAIEYFYKALQAKSFAPKPHLHDESTYEVLGQNLYLYGDVHESRRITKAGTLDYPNAANLWLYLALSEYKLNDREAALNAIRKAEELSQDQNTEYVYIQIINNKPIKLLP